MTAGFYVLWNLPKLKKKKKNFPDDFLVKPKQRLTDWNTDLKRMLTVLQISQIV